MYFSDNVESSSKNLWKIIPAGKLMQNSKVVYFSFDFIWYSIQLDIVH